jgi:predicted Fe-Mo cluster-binding NifX family protein
MERRKAPRHYMIKGAEVVLSSRLLRGAVLDLSATGARIHLFSPMDVPDVVVLRLPNGVTHTASRRWQRDTEAGFEFRRPPRLRLVQCLEQLAA